jgi:hypothetical protein
MGWNHEMRHNRTSGNDMLAALLICGAIVLVCAFGAVWAIIQILGYLR